YIHGNGRPNCASGFLYPMIFGLLLTVVLLKGHIPITTSARLGIADPLVAGRYSEKSFVDCLWSRNARILQVFLNGSVVQIGLGCLKRKQRPQVGRHGTKFR